MTEEIEVKARRMGWFPKESFKGDPERWVDAAEYVRRGEEVLPIVQANNRDLQLRVDQATRELQETKQLLSAATESIEALKEFNSEMSRQKVKEHRQEIAQALVQAKKEGDAETEVELQSQLNEADQALREAGKKPDSKPAEAKPNGSPPEIVPEVKAWMKDNPWFGTDFRKTGLANGVAEEIRAKNPGIKGQAFLDALDEELSQIPGFGNPERESPARMEGGGGRGNGSGNGQGKGRNYASLPAEAKAACDRQGKRLVGPGRAFKDEESWRKHYVSKYQWD